MKSVRIEELASLLGATPEGESGVVVSGVNDLAHAGPDDLSFYANPRYCKEMQESRAGVIIMRPGEPKGLCRSYLLHPDPSVAFQKALLLFQSRATLSGFFGIHPTAVVHERAVLEEGVTVSPYAVIDADVHIGKKTFIGAHVFIGPRTIIGESVVIHPHAIVREDSCIRDRVVIQPGAVIGSCGFGYTTDTEGIHTKLEQLGNVVLENDVEIGANTTIDRARFKSTTIGEGTKVDNLVQIAHNVEIGERSLIVAQVGIAGSTKIGKHVVLAGKVAINGHIELGDGVRITACSAVSKSLPHAGDYGGVPAMPLAEYNKYAVQLRRVGTLFQRVKALETALQISSDAISSKTQRP